jgi:serine/threonine protein kinase
MGEVYLASDTKLGRQVALKLLPPRFTLDPERVRRFEKEARAASALNHPNIVTIHEIGHFDNVRFIVTEFVEGRTLRQLMNDKPFTLNEALNVTIQVAVALTSAHTAGIVHRDIKPENIMLRADGYVKILDFGLAKLTETQTSGSDPETPTLLKSNPGLLMGTVQYMSPEQARGKKVDVRTDIWSLGIVLYELLAGRVPFSGETPSHVMVSLMEDELPALTGYPNVPAELDRIVTNALRKDQKNRYKSAREFADDLKALKRDLQVEARLKGMLEAVPDSTAGMTGAQRSSQARELASETLSLRKSGTRVTGQTFSAKYLSAGIKRHRYFAVAALLVLCGGAIGLTFFLRKHNKSSVSAGPTKSIAVLPARPESPIRDEIYEIGIADSLIRRLSSIDGLVVRPLSATRQYSGATRNLNLALTEHVDYLLISYYQLRDGKKIVGVVAWDYQIAKIIDRAALRRLPRRRRPVHPSTPWSTRSPDRHDRRRARGARGRAGSDSRQRGAPDGYG